MSDSSGPPDEFPTLTDLEESAKRVLPSRVWAYVQGGSGDERTLRRNRAAFEKVRLRPRVLANVSEVRLDSTVLGQPVSAPIYIAPMAYGREIHPDAELGIARAAGSQSLLAMYSTLSSDSLEKIAENSPAPHWFQLYLQPGSDKNRELVTRAQRAGFSAIVLTVDCPVLGVRDSQARAGFAIDESVPIGNGSGIVPPSRAPSLDQGVFRLRADAAATWDTVDELRRETSLPLVIKGILTEEDTHQAIRHGAKAVVVSNHGGRQLDGAPAALEALPEVVRAARGQLEVYLDGGVRRGSDILAALALGAKAVGVGRPILWSLALQGGPGVGRYLAALKSELATEMALVGRRNLTEVDSSLVSRMVRTEAPDRPSVAGE